MNKNTVELLGFYGGDITHAMSGWTSTQREFETKRHRMPEFLAQLAANGHKTPFEKSSLHFLVTSDIATHIHLLKHRIAVSINTESARYKELKEDKYYLPEDWRKNPKLWDEDLLEWKWYNELKMFTEASNSLYHQCLEELTPILGRKRAKESARYFKTYNSQVTQDIMFNFSSFVHFFNLRSKPDAQAEDNDIAFQMLEIINNLPETPFKYSIEAFKLYE